LLTAKITLTLFLIISVFLSLVGLGGAAIAFLSVFIFSWLTHFTIITGSTLWVLFFIALIAEVVEIMAGSIGAKTFDASKQAVWGSVIGIFIGLLFSLATFQFYLIFVGLIIGVILGDLIAGRTEAKIIFKSVIGVLIGKVGGIIIKTALTIIIVIISLISLY